MNDDRKRITVDNWKEVETKYGGRHVHGTVGDHDDFLSEPITLDGPFVSGDSYETEHTIVTLGKQKEE